MSVEDFKKYGQMIAQDEKVRARAKEIGVGNVDGQISYAKTLGLNWTQQDLAKAVKESGASSKELSEEQLEQVAGGAITSTAAAVVGAAAGLVAAGVGAASLSVQVGAEASTRW